MNEMITIDGKLMFRPVDIPKPQKRGALDMVLDWMEKEDRPAAKLAAKVIIGFAGLYFLGQAVRYMLK